VRRSGDGPGVRGEERGEDYELELTCRSESYPGGHDDTVEEPTPVPGAPEPTPVVRMEGKKGPTFFVDISSPWRQQI